MDVEYQLISIRRLENLLWKQFLLFYMLVVSSMALLIKFLVVCTVLVRALLMP